MSKFWRIPVDDDVELDPVVRVHRDRDQTNIIGPYASSPHANATEFDLDSLPEDRLRKLKDKLEIHGADTSEVDAALAPIDDTTDKTGNPLADRLVKSTKAQRDAWVDANLTNLATARTVIKHLLNLTADQEIRLRRLESGE